MLQEIDGSDPNSRVEAAQLGDLLLELSAKLSNVNFYDLDEEIRKDLQIIGNYLNFDWITLCEFPESRPKSNRIFYYSRPLVDPPPISTIYKDTAGLIEKVKSGNILFYPSVPNDHTLSGLKEEDWGKIFCLNYGIKTTLALPLINDKTVFGAMYLSSIRRELPISDELITRLYFFTQILASTVNRKTPVRKIERDYIDLDVSLIYGSGQCTIIGESPAFKRILNHAKQVADTNITVLLTGETGTGKGVMAKAIHNASKRKDRQMVQINCASLSPGIIESELFGHEKGAFTGAHTRRTGCFERAHESTLFLDEIGELPVELQAKLLRVLQDGEFERVGGSETVKCDVRIIAATNRCLKKEIESGKFRRDLYYRLNIFEINIPPLRERAEDLPLFIDFFLKKYSKMTGKNFDELTEENIKKLLGYPWPGNIRELENLVARSVITSPGNNLILEIPASSVTSIAGKTSLEDFERTFISETLEDTMWRIEGMAGAAKRLNMKPSTLRDRIKKLNIKRPLPN